MNPAWWRTASADRPLIYKTRNWPAYNDALKRRGSLTIRFDPAMTWEAAPTGRRGRQPACSDAAVQTCLTMKVLFGMALRPTTGFVDKYLQQSGFASVLVNLGHVGQEGEAISLDAFAYSQGLRPSDALTFVRRNDLSCQQVRGPRGGAQLRMSAADREAFHDQFISFRTLGVIARLGWSELQARLDSCGIRPTGGSARIYSRADVAYLLI